MARAYDRPVIGYTYPRHDAGMHGSDARYFARICKPCQVMVVKAIVDAPVRPTRSPAFGPITSRFATIEDLALLN